MAPNDTFPDDPDAARALRIMHQALVLVHAHQSQLSASQHQLSLALRNLATLVEDAHRRGIDVLDAVYAVLDDAGILYMPLPAQRNAPVSGVASPAHLSQRSEQGEGRSARTRATTSDGTHGGDDGTFDAGGIVDDDGGRAEQIQQELIGDVEEDDHDPNGPGQRLHSLFRTKTLSLKDANDDKEDDASSALTKRHPRLHTLRSATPAVHTDAGNPIRATTRSTAKYVLKKVPQKSNNSQQTDDVGEVDKSKEILCLFKVDGSDKYHEYFCFICGCNANSRRDYFGSAENLWHHITRAHGPPDDAFFLRTGLQIADVAAAEYEEKVILRFCVKQPSDDEVAHCKKHGPPNHHKRKFEKGRFNLQAPQYARDRARRPNADGSQSCDGAKLVRQYMTAHPGKKAARKTIPPKDRADYWRDSGDEAGSAGDGTIIVVACRGAVDQTPEDTKRNEEAAKTLFMMFGTSEDGAVTPQGDVDHSCASTANTISAAGGSIVDHVIAATATPATAREVPKSIVSSRPNGRLTIGDNNKSIVPPPESNPQDTPIKVVAKGIVGASMSQPKSARYAIAPLLSLKFAPTASGLKKRRRRSLSLVSAFQSYQRSQSITPANPLYHEQTKTQDAPSAAADTNPSFIEEGMFRGFDFSATHLIADPRIVDLGKGWRVLKCPVSTCDDAVVRGNSASGVQDMLEHLESEHPGMIRVYSESIGILLSSCTSTRVHDEGIGVIQAGQVMAAEFGEGADEDEATDETKKRKRLEACRYWSSNSSDDETQGKRLKP